MTLVRTAAAYGALAASRARVIGFLREGERVVGVRAKDLEADEVFEVRAKQIVNATGVWTDETQAMVGERGQFHVRASKGIHLVVPRDRIHSRTGIILRTEVNRVLATPLTRDDVEGVYAGLRPLLAGESEATSQLSREHVVAHSAPGLVVVAGGKYTTYRVMARDAIDAAVHAMDEKVAPSCTEDIGLLGSEGYRAL